MKFELVLPCYNEEKSLELLIKRAADAAAEAGFSSNDFKLVLVENGSRDGSLAKMRELQTGPLGSWFRIVPVEINQGYGHGLWQGLRTTSAEIVGWSHADQQCDPKDALIAYDQLRIRGSRALIKGTRYGRALKDRFVSRVFQLFSKTLLGLRLQELNAQPKVFHRNLLERLRNPPKDFAFDLYVLYHAQKSGLEVHEIPVHFPPRIHGLSNWSAHFLGRYKTILKMISYMRSLARQEGRL